MTDHLRLPRPDIVDIDGTHAPIHRGRPPVEDPSLEPFAEFTLAIHSPFRLELAGAQAIYDETAHRYRDSTCTRARSRSR